MGGKRATVTVHTKQQISDLAARLRVSESEVVEKAVSQFDRLLSLERSGQVDGIEIKTSRGRLGGHVGVTVWKAEITPCGVLSDM